MKKPICEFLSKNVKSSSVYEYKLDGSCYFIIESYYIDEIRSERSDYIKVDGDHVTFYDANNKMCVIEYINIRSISIYNKGYVIKIDFSKSNVIDKLRFMSNCKIDDKDGYLVFTHVDLDHYYVKVANCKYKHWKIENDFVLYVCDKIEISDKFVRLFLKDNFIGCVIEIDQLVDILTIEDLS